MPRRYLATVTSAWYSGSLGIRMEPPPVGTYLGALWTRRPAGLQYHLIILLFPTKTP